MKKRKATILITVLTLLLTTWWWAGNPTGGIAATAFNEHWTEPVVLDAHEGAVTAIAFSGDNQWLATGGEDGKTYLWHTGDAPQDPVLIDTFVRADPTSTDPNGHNVREHCGDDYPEASAEIVVRQQGGGSTVYITLRDARPETLYTAWLRLQGETLGDERMDYGGSPITGAGSTPLAAASELGNLIAAAEGVGVTDVANGVWTDAEGNGELIVELDFPLLGGAYPFHKYDNSLAPVAITGAPFAPFTIRIVSHCTDLLGHGVSAGSREPWFNWSPQLW